MPWYDGPTLLEHLETIELAADRNTRTGASPCSGSSARWPRSTTTTGATPAQVAGGDWRVGDEVVVLPSGARSRSRRSRRCDGRARGASRPVGDDPARGRRRRLARRHARRPGAAAGRRARAHGRALLDGERPVEHRARCSCKHTTRTSRRVSRSSSRSSTCRRSRIAAPGRIELNDLGVAGCRLAEPLVVDPYARNRATGAFILIDEATNETVGAGMVIDAAHDAAPIPYRDLTVIDSRAPRTNQAIVGVVSLVAIVTGWWWLLALLALQLALGLLFGRRYCLPCLSTSADPAALRRRADRGLAPAARREHRRLRFLTAASIAYRVGATTVGLVLGAIVAALALLAATTGFCTGCQAYKLGRRLTGRPFVSCPIPGAPR